MAGKKSKKDGSQAAVAQKLIGRVDAVAKDIPAISAAATKLTTRQLGQVVTVGQEFMDAGATVLAAYPELQKTTKLTADDLRLLVRRSTAFEGLRTSVEGLLAAIDDVVERGWADGVLKADRVLRAAETLHENEEDPKKQDKLQRQIDAMAKARTVRRKSRKGSKRRAASGKSKSAASANGNGKSAAPPPAPPAKVQRSVKKTTEEETTESEG